MTRPGRWPNGPRFIVLEIRGYIFSGYGAEHERRRQYGSATTQTSDFLVLDVAYASRVVRTIQETGIAGGTRHESRGIALYVAAALNADPLSYVAKLKVDSLRQRAKKGLAPNYQDGRGASRVAKRAAA